MIFSPKIGWILTSLKNNNFCETGEFGLYFAEAPPVL